jgi:O-antigen/teichoic acid export membrane protein
MANQRRVIFIIGITQIFNYVVPLVTFPLLVRSFAIENYGMWIEAATVTGLALAFSSSALNAGMNTLAMSQIERRDAIYANALYLFLLICGGLSLGIAFAAPLVNSLTIRAPEGILLLQITAWSVLSGALHEFVSLIFRLHHEAQKSAIFVILLAISRVATAAIALLTHNLLIFAILYVLSQCTIILAEVLVAFRKIRLSRPDSSLLGQIMRHAINLVIVSQSNWLVMYGDRLMLTILSTSTAVAVYAASYQITAILTALGAPFLYSLLPNVGERWNAQDIPGVQLLIRNSTRLMVILLIPAVVGLALVGNALLRVLASDDFAQGWLLIVMVAAGIALETLGNAFQFIFYAQGRPQVMRRAYFQGAILNLTANLVAIPVFGYNGAGFTTLVTYVYIFYSLWRATKMPFPVLIDLQTVWRCTLAAGLMSLWVIPMTAPTIPRLLLAASGGAIIYGITLLELRVLKYTELATLFQTARQRFVR